MTIWKQVIDTELRTAAEWEENWGFLKAPKRLPKRQGAQADMMAATHTGSIGGSRSQSPAAVTPTFKTAGKSVFDRPATGENIPTSRSQMSDVDDRFRVLTRYSKVPKDRFVRPMTTTQEVGWRTSLEKFGVNHHGIRRSKELWPEI
eukprot:CAMPEP_0169142858 /NCGR_PEP_ID=MMETSP1015-20121227/45219_1 /TAXON_ID=342587 /ORGANISM="Karlodinium micrum, Strain CCMP2283" /LENGTH=146 /DNA_ID=CAMNT_0009209643 /DNA_START=116 /DNA_END=556 /DNA_ORIENTATION=-